jgi:hypothetical protein
MVPGSIGWHLPLGSLHASQLNLRLLFCEFTGYVGRNDPEVPFAPVWNKTNPLELYHCKNAYPIIVPGSQDQVTKDLIKYSNAWLGPRNLPMQNWRFLPA